MIKAVSKRGLQSKLGPHRSSASMERDGWDRQRSRGFRKGHICALRWNLGVEGSVDEKQDLKC